MFHHQKKNVVIYFVLLLKSRFLDPILLRNPIKQRSFDCTENILYSKRVSTNVVRKINNKRVDSA